VKNGRGPPPCLWQRLGVADASGTRRCILFIASPTPHRCAWLSSLHPPPLIVAPDLCIPCPCRKKPSPHIESGGQGCCCCLSFSLSSSLCLRTGSSVVTGCPRHRSTRCPPCEQLLAAVGAGARCLVPSSHHLCCQ
jgi:hypothetical protein